MQHKDALPFLNMTTYWKKVFYGCALKMCHRSGKALEWFLLYKDETRLY